MAHENPRETWATSEEVALLREEMTTGLKTLRKDVLLDKEEERPRKSDRALSMDDCWQEERNNNPQENFALLHEEFSLLRKENDHLREEIKTLREKVLPNKEANRPSSLASELLMDDCSMEEPNDWQENLTEQEEIPPHALLAPPQPTVLADNSESGDWELLPHDTFSFLAFGKPESFAFICGTLVACTQFTMLALLIADVFDSGSDGNPIGVPPNVTGTLRLVQIFAFIVSTLSQEDVHQSLNVFYYGYDEKTLGDAFGMASSWNMWMLSLVLRFLEGMFGLVAAFLLIMTESTAKDILLNFTAVQFISYLDDVAFVLAKWGYFGRALQRDAIMVVDAQCSLHDGKRRIRRSLILCFTFAGMLGFWAWIYIQQETGQFLCSTLFIQFGDEFSPELGTFSGLYDKRTSSSRHGGARRVEYIEHRNGRFVSLAILGYCPEESAWTIAFGDSFEDIPDPCQWRAKSSPIEPNDSDSFDILATSSYGWITSNDEGREVPLEYFHLSCYDCHSDANFCGGSDRGTCVNNRCECTDGWYGLRCEFSEPCSSLEIDTRYSGFLGAHEWSDKFHILQSNSEGGIVNVYGRPVYKSDGELFDIIFFTGRRWALTVSTLLGHSDQSTIADYLTNDFHGHWSDYTVAFLSEPVDVDKRTDELISPEGLSWFQAKESFLSEVSQTSTVSHSPDTNRQSDAVLLCAKCDNVTNPCFYRGLCSDDGVCTCMTGSTGVLCQEPPNGNGLCNLFFNTPEFGHDGGDCCMASCASTEYHKCGNILSSSAFGIQNEKFIGYPHCRDPIQTCDNPNEVCWKPSSADTSGESIDAESGSSVFLSGNGEILAVAEPGASRVKVFVQDGMEWAQRGQILEGPTGSRFGTAIAISNDGNVLAVGVFETAHDNSYVKVFIWEAGSNEWISRPQIPGTASSLYSDSIGDIGFSVALSSDGSILAVGSPGYEPEEEWEWNDNGIAGGVVSEGGETKSDGIGGTGRVMVYQYKTAEDWEMWEQLGDGIVGRAAFDNAGFSVALSGKGDILAFGAPECDREDCDDLSKPGYVGVYKFSPTTQTWTQLGNLLTGGGMAGDVFGLSVALSYDGLILAVGNSGNDDTARSTGQAQVYHFKSNVWMQLGTDLLGKRPNDQLGWSVSLSSDGNILAVGAAQKSVLAQGDSGYVEVFKYDHNITQWIPHGQAIHRTHSEDFSGYPVSLSDDGNMLAIGAPFYSGKKKNSGRVRVYRNAATGLPNQNSPNTTASTESLVSISVSIQFDAYPEDIEARLVCDEVTLFDFRPSTFSVPNELIRDTFLIANASECVFTIRDASSDGLCCSEGKGFYHVHYGDNATNPSNLLAQGGQLFRSSEQVAFTALPPSASLVPITIVLQLDLRSFETGVTFQCGESIISKAPGFVLDPRALIMESFLVEEGAKCEFSITDSSELAVLFSGICCAAGFGSYQLYYGDNTTNQESLIAQGSQFHLQDIVHFNAFPNSTVSAAGLVPFKIMVQLDLFPGHISFILQCGTVVLLDVPLIISNPGNPPFERTYFVEEGTECQMTVLDAAGDGLCCENGQGYVRIYLGGDNDATLIFDEGEIGHGTRVNFTVSLLAQDPILSIDPVTNASTPWCGLCEDGNSACYPDLTVSFPELGDDVTCKDVELFFLQTPEGSFCSLGQSLVRPVCCCGQG